MPQDTLCSFCVLCLWMLVVYVCAHMVNDPAYTICRSRSTDLVPHLSNSSRASVNPAGVRGRSWMVRSTHWKAFVNFVCTQSLKLHYMCGPCTSCTLIQVICSSAYYMHPNCIVMCMCEWLCKDVSTCCHHSCALDRVKSACTSVLAHVHGLVQEFSLFHSLYV